MASKMRKGKMKMHEFRSKVKEKFNINLDGKNKPKTYKRK